VGGGGGVAAGALIDLSILSCRVADNQVDWGDSGGISCWSPILTIRDCVIVDNFAHVLGIGGGLAVSFSSGTIEGCTIARNFGQDSAALFADSDIAFRRNIVALNNGTGLYCYESEVDLECCDL
jgi:hypothetical protein